MIDFSFIGKDGLIIQYEDVISLVGYNIIKYLRKNNIDNKIISKMSIEDILLSYINRENEDISIWLNQTFEIDDFDINDYKDSINTFQPNLMYAFKIVETAYRNGISNIIIHSDIKSNIIKKMTELFNVPIEYTFGDIVPVLDKHMNYTFITASPKNIMRCLDTSVPFALTIIEDFLYVGDIIIKKIDEKLRNKDIYVCYTSILSAGLI